MATDDAKTREGIEAEDSGGQAQLGLKTPARREFSQFQRIKLFLAGWLGWFAVSLIGSSLRWEVYGRHNYDEAVRRGKRYILTLWHREIFPAVWYWRKEHIVVMASENFDGEFVARIIQNLGGGAVRGSSSRGAVRVVVDMVRKLREGFQAAVTPDGPRGPRFVAKPGVAQIAKLSGASILCFHIVPRKSWVLRKSWDQTEFPKPFSRTAIFIAPAIEVPRGADEKQLAEYLQLVQATLEGLQVKGREWREGKASSSN